MAPSVAEIKTEAAPVVVPVKAAPETTETKPKVRRAIDEEGGKTTAKVEIIPISSLEEAAR